MPEAMYQCCLNGFWCLNLLILLNILPKPCHQCSLETEESLLSGLISPKTAQTQIHIPLTKMANEKLWDKYQQRLLFLG